MAGTRLLHQRNHLALPGSLWLSCQAQHESATATASTVLQLLILHDMQAFTHLLVFYHTVIIITAAVAAADGFMPLAVLRTTVAATAAAGMLVVLHTHPATSPSTFPTAVA
jgi:hypothetical protein